MDMTRILCPFFVYTFLGDSVKKVILFFILLILPFSVNAFSSNAKATVLMDMDSKRVLYSENPHYKQSVASISKVMTAILAIENGNLNRNITVGDEVLKAYGSAIYLKMGEEMKLHDLLYGLMLRSGNDAALVIAHNIAGSEKNFVNYSYKELLVIQAIKGLGNKKYSSYSKEILQKFLTTKETKDLISKSKYQTKWVYQKLEEVYCEKFS